MFAKPFWKFVTLPPRKIMPLGLISRRIFSAASISVGVLVQVGDDAVVPIQGSGPLQLNEEVGEEDVPGPLDHEHQAAGLLNLQLPRVGVGGKACLPHDLEHMLLGLGPDIRPIIDDARNGATEQPLMRAMSLIVISRALAFGWIFGNGVGNVSSGYSMAQFVQKSIMWK